MKILTFYLPQFHTIPENDKWWGKGFTEWTSVRKAKPLFNKHYQPREPLQDNYYNLLDQNVMEEQMKLAEKYGIGGFCFYHYWFCGKQLLEKPVEQLLCNSKANLPFCLSWANEPWTKAWNGKEGEKELLQVQDYGDERDWTKHFMYLLPLFNDKRYIRMDDKPVFLIYRSFHILKCDQMLNLWKKLAVENGLKGIYFISMETVYEIDNRHREFDASIEFEPMRSIRELGQEVLEKRRQRLRKLEKYENTPFSQLYLDKISYDDCYKVITSREHRNKNKKVYLGAFVDWDNTPRKGKKGLIIHGGSPQKFKQYLKQQIKRSVQLNNEFLFINAWNEWSEAAYLEPDKKYGYAYLHSVRQAINETIEGK
ncbi:MAG: lipopolysaccharide biosynthesis protein [Herbinix sp.]|jgi:hypothetical protein|nr:lipopolysaccharide biosynthesis protein [Herbinix sp.]